MSLASRYRNLFSSNESAKRSLVKGRRPLRLEPLEDRRMLSITLFVDDDAAAGGYGLSWSTAHANLQDALTMAEVLNADEIAANDVDQIWIAEGTYYPTKELEPGDARSASFSLLDGVSLYGGFAGTETSLGERDLSLAHTTTLSGDLGTLDDTSDNAYTVVYCDKNVEATLDGLSITGGNANGDASFDYPERRYGGGIFDNGTLTITNSNISDNSADFAGGGICTRNFSGSVTSLTITNSTFSDNSTNSSGAGIYSYDTMITILNSQFLGNSANASGGGIDCYSNTTATPLTITNSTFLDNSTGSSGGGINIFSNGGTAALTMTNSTFSGNLANSRGGGINTGNGAKVTLNNTIVADNTASNGPDIYFPIGTLSGSHNLIGDGTDQTLLNTVDGNLVGTPKKPINPMLDDIGRPLNGSPAVNKGNNDLIPDGLLADLAGNDRIFGGTVDIGAYERQIPYRLPGDANLDGKVDGSDVTILAGNWQAGVVNAVHATWAMGDFNGDGKVDGSDVTILAGNWQAGIPTNPPQLDNPIVDMLLDDGDSQPALIDLTTVFSDPNSELTFSAVSSNPDLVTIQIVDSTKLQVTYIDYAFDQDRTPAEIIVTATEVGGDLRSVSDEFTVTVTPTQPMEVYLIVRDTATDIVTAEKTTALPTSIDTIEVGSSYIVEIWVTNTFPNGTSGLGAGVGDLGFYNTLGSATSLSHVGPFDTLTDGTIDNANGEITDFGGVRLAGGAAIAPYYSRLGYVEFEAFDAGTQHFAFDVNSMCMLSGGVVINLNQINVTEASVAHEVVEDIYTFDLGDSSTVVSGMIAGVALGPSVGCTNSNISNYYMTSGSLAVAFDDYNTPTSMTIPSGTLDPGLYDGPSLRPGVGGTNSAAPANFGLANDSIELAIRDLVFGFSSDPLLVTAGTYFHASDIEVTFSSGTIDYLTSDGTAHGTIDLTAETLTAEPNKSGSIGSFGYLKAIYYSIDYTVDLSHIFGADSELTFSIEIDANYDPPEPVSTASIASQSSTVFQPPVDSLLGLATVKKRDATTPRQFVRPSIAAVDFLFSQ